MVLVAVLVAIQVVLCCGGPCNEEWEGVSSQNSGSGEVWDL